MKSPETHCQICLAPRYWSAIDDRGGLSARAELSAPHWQRGWTAKAGLGVPPRLGACPTKKSLRGFGIVMRRPIEAVCATAATIRHQPHDPHQAVEEALWHGPAHIHPAARGTARAFPALAFARGVLHAPFSVTSRTSDRKPSRQLRQAGKHAHGDRSAQWPRGEGRRPRPAAAILRRFPA
jgi:hypothetical protein